MAFAATNHTAPANHPSFIRRGFAALGAFFLAYAKARSHHDEIAALTRLSDYELAERGLTRDGIVRHVFSGSFYL